VSTPNPANSRAVLLGTYSGTGALGLGDLPAVERNLSELRRILTNGSVWALASEHCLYLPQPRTERTVLRKLERAAIEATDTLLVYYAGHGLLVGTEERLHLAMPGARWGDECLSYEKLQSRIGTSVRQSRRTLVILDCCYSGRALEGRMGSPRDIRTFIASKTDIEGVCVITASAATREAIAPVGAKFTAFTGEFIRVISAGIPGGTEFLDMTTIYGEVAARMAESPTLPQPQFGTRGQGGGIILTRNRAWVAPSPPSIHNEMPQRRLGDLQRQPSRIVGREQELTKLLQIAKQTTSGEFGPAVCVLHGMGGVGKTTLALAAAHKSADLFPDGHVTIELYGFTPDKEPRQPDDVLVDLLQQIGFRPAEIPTTGAARAEAWRSWLKRRRVLLILDNAVDEQQIRPLLPGQKSCSLVLITSRRQLEIDSVHSMQVRTLTSADAVQILKPEARHTDIDILLKIANLCGHLPLALRPVAQLVRDIDEADVLAAMQANPNPLYEIPEAEAGVLGAFTVSYQRLPDDLRNVLHSCAIHPGPDFDKGSIAAISGLPLAVAAVRLTRLAQRSMLLTKVSRYYLHDLFLRYTREAIVRDERDVNTVVANLSTYLIASARCALTQIVGKDPSLGDLSSIGSFTDPDTARNWLTSATAELENVANAAIHSRDSHAIELTNLIMRWACLDERTQQAQTLSSRIAQLAKDTGDRLGQINALNGLADAARLEGHYPIAIRHYRQALTLAQQSDDRNGEASALNGLGHVARLRADYPTATGHYRQALTLAQQSGDRISEASALNGLGDAARLQADYPTAAGHYQQALTLAQQAGDRLGQTYALNGLGHAARLQADYPAATSYYQQALTLAQQARDRIGQAYAFTGLGHIARLQADLVTAVCHYQYAVSLTQELHNRLGQINALNGLGDAALAQADYPTAIRTYQRALSVAAAIGNRPGQINALNGLGDAGLAQADYSAAIDNYRRALKLAQDASDRLGQADAFKRLGDVSLAQADYLSAARNYKDALLLAEAIDEIGLIMRSREQLRLVERATGPP
jgi:tetratricopeptide (TPR) repeat protein